MQACEVMVWTMPRTFSRAMLQDLGLPALREGVMSEHICDPTVQPCPCGWRWEYRVEDSRGHRYTTSTVVDRFMALYGEPQGTRFIREPEQTPNEGENA